MSKKKIRNFVLKIRKNKNFHNNPFKINQIFKFVSNLNFKKKIIGCHYPINFEVNIVELIRKLQEKNIQVGLPIVDKNFQMNFYQYKINDPLLINNLGIPEPLRKKKIIPNILIVPLVAFDKNLNRLGYGGGYYDRFIEKMYKRPLIKIGVALDCQKIKKVPVDKFDKKLNFIFTEKRLIK